MQDYNREKTTHKTDRQRRQQVRQQVRQIQMIQTDRQKDAINIMRS